MKNIKRYAYLIVLLALGCCFSLLGACDNKGMQELSQSSSESSYVELSSSHESSNSDIETSDSVSSEATTESESFSSDPSSDVENSTNNSADSSINSSVDSSTDSSQSSSSESSDTSTDSTSTESSDSVDSSSESSESSDSSESSESSDSSTDSSVEDSSSSVEDSSSENEDSSSVDSSSSNAESSSNENISSSGEEPPYDDGKIEEVEPILPPHEHSFEESVQTEPTCLEEGVKLFSCTGCEYTETAPISPLGHEETPIDAVPATCKETGLSEGIGCSRCTAILTPQETTPIVDHSYHEDMGVCIWCDLTELCYVLGQKGLEKYALCTGPRGYAAHRVVIPSTYVINGQELPVKIATHAFMLEVEPDENIGFERQWKGRNDIYSLEIGEGVKAEKEDEAAMIFADCYNLVEVFNASNIQFDLFNQRYTGQTVTPLYYVVKTADGYINKAARDASGNITYNNEIPVEGFTSRVTVDENGYVIYTEGDEKILVGYNRRAEQFLQLRIPDGITKIKSYALNTCNTIISVTIPSSVTTIEKWAFFDHSIQAEVFIEGQNVWDIFNGARQVMGLYDCSSLDAKLLWNEFTKKGVVDEETGAYLQLGFMDCIWIRVEEDFIP